MTLLEVLLLSIVVAVLFAALGLFYHLFSSRLETITHQIADLAKELRSVSPLQAYQRITEVQAELLRVQSQIGQMAGREADRDEKVATLAENVDVVTHGLADISTQIHNLRSEVASWRGKKIKTVGDPEADPGKSQIV